VNEAVNIPPQDPSSPLGVNFSPVGQTLPLEVNSCYKNWPYDPFRTWTPSLELLLSGAGFLVSVDVGECGWFDLTRRTSLPFNRLPSGDEANAWNNFSTNYFVRKTVQTISVRTFVNEF
jgi:hypothetical protein